MYPGRQGLVLWDADRRNWQAAVVVVTGGFRRVIVLAWLKLPTATLARRARAAFNEMIRSGLSGSWTPKHTTHICKILSFTAHLFKDLF